MKKHLLQILLGSLILTSIASSIAFAAGMSIPEVTYTPVRNAKDITSDKSFPGFDYITYNNFIYGGTDSGSAIGLTNQFDERKFTWSNHAAEKDANSKLIWAKGWKGDFQTGEKILIGVRFHNNSMDPYDGLAPLISPKETTVSAGIDISDTSKPLGFIYAPNNRYKNAQGNILKYTASDYKAFGDTGDVKTASDYIILNSTTGQEIKLTLNKSKANLLMGYDYDENGKIEGSEWITKSGTNSFIGVTSTGTSLNIPVETLNEVTNPITKKPAFPGDYKSITRTIKLKTDGDNKEWIEFPNHPGCFKYSGWVFFEATVEIVPEVPQNFCSGLSLTSPTGGALSHNETTLETPFKATVNFLYTILNFKPESITFKSTDPAGQVAIGTGAYKTIPASGLTMPLPDLWTVEGKFKGTGTFSVVYTDANGVTLPGKTLLTTIPACKAEFTTPTTEPDLFCRALLLGDAADPLKDPKISCTDNATNYFYFSSDILFTGTEPSNQYIKFTSTDSKSTVSIYVEEGQTEIKNVKTNGQQGAIIKLPNMKNGIYRIYGIYNGLGSLKAEYVTANGTPIPGEPMKINGVDANRVCQAEVKACDNSCKNICLTAPTSFPEGSYSEVSGRTLDYYGDKWTHDITYSSIKENGKFYKKSDYNRDGVINDNDLIYAVKQDYPRANPVKNSSAIEQCNLSLNFNFNFKTSKELLYVMSQSFTSPTTMNLGLKLAPKTYGQNNVFGAAPIKAETLNTNVADKIMIPTQTIRSTTDDGAMVTPATINPTTDDGAAVSANPSLTVPQNETVWFYASAEGKDVAFVYTSEDPNNANCKKSLSISNQPPEENVCRALDLKVTQLDGNIVSQNPTQLNSNENYKLTPSVTFNPINKTGILIKYDATSRRAENTPYGYFAETTKVQIPYVGEITVPVDFDKWAPEITVPRENEVYFFANQSLVSSTYANAIRISVVGTDVPTCQKSLALFVPAQNACTGIVLKPAQKDFDPTTRTQITIDENLSSFGDYDGNFTFKITQGSGYLFSTADATNGGPSFSITKAEAVSTGVYVLASGSITVEVTADDASQVGCRAVLAYQEESSVCNKITLHTDTDPHLNPLQTETLYISGDFGSYTGNFTFHVTAGAAAKLSSASTKDAKTVTVSLEEAKNGITFFSDTDENTAVEVFATDESATKCRGQVSHTKTNTDECINLEIVTPDSPWTLSRNQDEEDFKIYVTPANKDWIIDWEATGDPTFKHPSTTSLKNTLVPFENSKLVKTTATITVRGYENDGVDATNSCKREIVAKTGGGSGGGDNDTPPKFTKKVKKGGIDNNGNSPWTDLLTVAGNGVGGDQRVTYQLKFNSGDDGINSVALSDLDLNSNEIKAKTNPYLRIQGYLKFEDIKITVGTHEIDACEYNGRGKLESSEENCLNEDSINDFKNGTGPLEINNLEDDVDIVVQYEMSVHSGLSVDSCRTLDPRSGCGITFDNRGQAEAYKSDEPTNKRPEWDKISSAKIIAVCPYVLTRAGGDSFFNKELETGIDISYCGEQKNINGPTILGINDTNRLNSTGTGSAEALPMLSSPTHDVCKFSNTDKNLGGYENSLKNFSSSICEMEMEVSDKWKPEEVTKQIISNADRVARFAEKPANDDWPTGTQKNIYKFENGLTINRSVQIENAHTYVIYGDLEINGDITYKEVFNYNKPNEVPSAAFIVIGGNIIVGKDVKQMDGIYIAVPNNGTGGAFTATDFTYNSPLVINGGLYGNVENLFSHRLYVGSVASDEGSVTIRYSENFIINTPPGLNDLMDITQLKTTY